MSKRLKYPACRAILMLGVLTALVVLLASAPMAAQSTTTGTVSGTITDPSGAVVTGATATLRSTETGRTSTSTSNSSGYYRFSLLPPGPYDITFSHSGFSNATTHVSVGVGQATMANVKLAVAAAAGQTVEVTAEGSALQADNGNISTTMSQALIENQPNPGNDLTYVAQTAPGAVMNTQSGYGNFATFGLPATSNLFTSNGMNDNDPFLNLNNSGATNLMLGTNDAREVTVVNNGYSVEYGGLAGSQINVVSKSGTNQWHGNAQYFYNWNGLNANNWFNDASGTPKPHAVANQWAASVGGPIRKDKMFFFVNTEGLYLAIPSSEVVPVPTAAFEAATLASIPAAEVPTYKQIFGLYNNAPGYSRAVPTGTPGVNQFRSTVGNHTHEWILSGRYDQNLSSADRMFIHFRMDKGLQATYTDPLTPVFNIQSTQPQYEGQLNLNHTFGSRAVNQFIFAASYYRAIFTVPSATAAADAFPYALNFAGATFYGIGGPFPVFTDANQNGRNVTQYQFLDDYSYHLGPHDLKFGVDFVRNDITDYRLLTFSEFGLQPGETLTDFAAGVATLGYTQQFPPAGRISAPLALYNLGMYGQDQWRVMKSLTITLGLRADHYSNPVCQISCFSRFASSFEDIPHNVAQPYNQSILYNQKQALNGFDTLNWSPRFGFAWSLGGMGLVLRGGVGLFFDRLPGSVADSMLLNVPFNNGFVVGNTPTISVPLSAAPATAAAANASFVNGFLSGGTLASISATNPFFAPPAFFNPARSLHSPRYQEWNFEIEKSLGPSMTFSINYVGNHGLHEAWTQIASNGYDPGGFGGLPLTAPDPRYSTVQQMQTSALSNYNGVTLSLQRRLRAFQFQFNYAWSHALDEISNGGNGNEPFNFDTNESIVFSQNPFNLRQFNYGNADYDARNYASLNFVYSTPKLKSNSWKAMAADWTVGGNLFARSGYPFTVIDSAASSTLFGQNFFPISSGVLFANQVIPGAHTCGPSAARVSAGSSSNPCAIMVHGYTPTSYGPGTANTWGAQTRNQIYGPHYTNLNINVMKNFKFPHWEAGKFAVGAQFFNIFNHPNFDQPVADIASPLYGTIQHTLNTPTSMYGAFLGADASARQIQLRATFSF